MTTSPVDTVTAKNGGTFKGWIYLGLFMVSIIADQFWTQSILRDTSWHKPIFLSLYCNAWIIIFLIRAYVWPTSPSERSLLHDASDGEQTKSHQEAFNVEGGAYTRDDLVSMDSEFVSLFDVKYTLEHSFLLGMKSSPLLVSDLLVYCLSLMHLTVPTTELISSFSVVSAYAGSVMLKRERFAPKSLIGISSMLLFAIMLYTVKPIDTTTGASADEPIGYLFALLAAFTYGSMSLFINYVNDPHSIGAEYLNEDALFGGQAVGTIISAIPILVIAHFTGIEPFEWPPIEVLFQLTLLAAVISPLVIFTFTKASMFLSPAVVQASGAACGPVSVILDQLGGGHQYPWGYLSGVTGMVVCCGGACHVIERSRSSVIQDNINRVTEEETKRLDEDYPDCPSVYRPPSHLKTPPLTGSKALGHSYILTTVP